MAWRISWHLFRVCIAGGRSGHSPCCSPCRCRPANGWGLSAEYRLGKGYSVTDNVFGDQLSDIQPGLITFFNTPKTRLNLGVSNSNTIGKGFGFIIIYKWQGKINWEGAFGSGPILPFGTLDAQINYKFTQQKILLKIGRTNITNHYYRDESGNPYIGGLYYASIAYNVFQGIRMRKDFPYNSCK